MEELPFKDLFIPNYQKSPRGSHRWQVFKSVESFGTEVLNVQKSKVSPFVSCRHRTAQWDSSILFLIVVHLLGSLIPLIFQLRIDHSLAIVTSFSIYITDRNQNNINPDQNTNTAAYTAHHIIRHHYQYKD